MTAPRVLLNNKQCCIVNLDVRESSGSHWIAIAQASDKASDNLIVYDSFGRSVVDGDVIHTESDPEQALVETNCGQRCLAWLCVFQQFGSKAALMV